MQYTLTLYWGVILLKNTRTPRADFCRFGRNRRPGWIPQVCVIPFCLYCRKATRPNRRKSPRIVCANWESANYVWTFVSASLVTNLPVPRRFVITGYFMFRRLCKTAEIIVLSTGIGTINRSTASVLQSSLHGQVFQYQKKRKDCRSLHSSWC